MVNAENRDKKYILLIEDEEIIANLIVSELTEAGYDVKVAQNGKEGIEKILEKKPDLVLLDILLPILNGFDVLEALKEKGFLPDLPVIIISNSGKPVEIERAKNLGIKDYLIKVNFSPKEILQKVENVFSSLKEEKKSAQQNVNPNAPNILIIEDDILLSDILYGEFLKANFNAQKALHANEARDILSKRNIDLILLDIILPDINGFDFLNELKANPKTKDIPVIILSNLGQKMEIEKGIELGAVDYVIKANVLPKDVIKKVADILKI